MSKLDSGWLHIPGGVGHPRRELNATRHHDALLLGAIFEGIYGLDADGRATFINPAAVEMLGWQPSDMIGRRPHGLMHHTTAAGAAYAPESCRIHAALEDGIARQCADEVFWRKDGTSFPVEWAATPIREKGRIVGAVVTFRDITERKRQELADHLLAEAGRVLGTSLDPQETMQSLMHVLVPDMGDWCTVELLGEDGEIRMIEVSAADPASTETILDVLQRFAEPTSLCAAPTEHVRHSREPLVWSTIPDELPCCAEQHAEHLDEVRKLGPRSAIYVPMLSRDQLIGTISLYSAKEGRRYDERDAALVQELARRAALSIENANLYRRAQQAIQARDDVLGFVAHDLRNPLSAISMIASLLMDTPLTEAARRKQLEGIVRSTRVIDSLIQDLLTVGQIEGGQLAVEATPTDPAALLEEALEAVSTAATAAGVLLLTDVGDVRPPVLADPKKIQRVLGNLLSNAVKFTPPGGRITLGADARGGGIHFSVADTGRGIAEVDLPHIFDRFWQARQSRTGGAGLGLAIARGIVQAHGGRIWAESELGEGTTFHFLLPRADGAEKPPPATQPEAVRPST
jgi:PAS domain S-box-containing protein